jgi:hypothetical protein
MYKCLTLKDPISPGQDPRAENPNISPRTAELIKMATAKSKSALFGLMKLRYATMDELIEAIHRCFVSNRP